MTSREFFYMVAEMRACQKAYFKSRDQLTLRAARKLENTIDKEIERVRLIINQDTPEPAAPPPAAARHTISCRDCPHWQHGDNGEQCEYPDSPPCDDV